VDVKAGGERPIVGVGIGISSIIARVGEYSSATPLRDRFNSPDMRNIIELSNYRMK
jgi:hypothetical protein